MMSGPRQVERRITSQGDTMGAEYKMDVVLFEREPGNWVAQCLQYDIGAQAESLPELVYEIQRSLVGHVVIALENDLDPFECLPAAPDEYRGKWEASRITIQTEEMLFRTPQRGPAVSPRLKVAA